MQIIKGTSLAAIIGFTEITRAGQIINNATFQPLIVFSVVAAIYFVLCWPLSLLAARHGAPPPHGARPLSRHGRPLPSSSLITQGDNDMIRFHQRRRFAIAAAGPRPRRRLRPPLATAQAQSVDEIKKKGELTVGLLVDFPPYGTVNSANQPDGYDADVARLLAKDWGVKLNLVPVTGPNRIPFLLTNKVDLLIASLAITPERAKQVQFSQALRGGDDRAATAKKTADQGPGRPQGPARRRRPREHAGHRR